VPVIAVMCSAGYCGHVQYRLLRSDFNEI